MDSILKDSFSRAYTCKQLFEAVYAMVLNRIKNLVRHCDDRGFFMEILRDDDGLLSRFGQASMSKAYPGVIKAFHYHEHQFEMHHYGPYSQDLYYRMDELVADNILTDTSETPKWSHYLPGDRADEIISTYHDEIEMFKDKIDNLLGLFGRFGPADLELLATIHYFYVTHKRYFRKPPSKNWVIDRVIMAKKDKFTPKLINDAYDALEVAGLFEWEKI